jgi:methylenetetrahydrofolate reductase (NADPH)
MARALRPLFVTVTWGAGGCTARKSLELAEICQRQLGLTTCLHLTCTNMNRSILDDALLEAKALGIRNILALRGDPPRSEEYEETEDGEKGGDGHEGEFVWAIDLVKYIKKVHGDWFCIGVAAYPEGHSDESHPTEQDFLHDLPYLVEKTQAGADFIMTQLFYDVIPFDRMCKILREHPSGAFKTLPIIPGLMPVQSYQILKRTTKLSHATLPESVLSRFEAVKGDDEAVKRIGVDVLSELVTSIKQTPSPGPKGFHFYTLNLEKTVSFILERCNLIPEKSDEEAINDTYDDATSKAYLNPSHPNGVDSTERRRLSSSTSDPHNKVIVDTISARGSGAGSNGMGSIGVSPPSTNFLTPADSAGVLRASLNTRAATLAISEGEGALGREATWDDYPNGRWGDARSPAYGEIDGYGVSLHVSITQAVKLWGSPKSRADINAIFLGYVEGRLEAIPWSEEGLNEETSVIQKELVGLNTKGWWTVASQPAVNGARSEDARFGWGPKGGFIFQKAFVELFVPEREWAILKERLDKEESVSWYAGNHAGDFEMSSQEAEDGGNAVTWGVFPGKEYVVLFLWMSHVFSRHERCWMIS